MPDSDGDGFTDAQEAARVTDPHQYTVVLKAGRYLISLGCVPDDNSVAAIFQGHAIHDVWVWDAGNGCYGSTDEVVPLCGHWVYVREHMVIEITLPDTVVVSTP